MKNLVTCFIIFLALLSTISCSSKKQGPVTSSRINTEFGRFSNKPNIILVTLDTTRADHLSCYGYPKSTTPNLEKFVREGGILFENAYSPASWTLPGHASIFTGMYVSKHGARFSRDGEAIWGDFLVELLDDSVPTLAEILKSEGYTTIGVVSGPFLREKFKLARGFDIYDDKMKIERKAGKVNEVAIRSLRDVSSPFFLFINYFDPHSPYTPPPPFNKAFSTPELLSRFSRRSQDTIRVDVMSSDRPISSDEEQYLISQYDGEIGYMDQQFGELIRSLQELNLYENTYIIITADHGECLGEHNHVGHGTSLYQPIIKVPLLMKYPRSSGEGATYQKLVETVDILPTLLFDLGITYADEVQGIRFFEEKQETVAESFLCNVCVGVFGQRYDQTLSAFIENNMKIIYSSKGFYELYDLSTDMNERSNLASSYPEKTFELATKLQNFLTSFEHADSRGSHIEMDEATRKQLRALGYLQ